MAIKDFYTDLKTQIETVTEVKTVRLFNDQFNQHSTESAWAYPAVFIEFLDITWETTQLANQQGSVTVRLHQGFESYQDEDTDILDTLELINKAVHGYQGASFTALQRTNDDQDTNHDQVIIWRTDYITDLVDCSATVKKDLVEAEITDIEINKDLIIDNYVIRTGALSDVLPPFNELATKGDGTDGVMIADIVGGGYTTAVIRSFSFWVKILSGTAVPFFCGNTTAFPNMPLFRWANGAGVYQGRLRWVLDNYRGSAIYCRAVSELVDGTGAAPNILDGGWHHVVIYNPVDSSANRANIANTKIWLDAVPLSLTTDNGSQHVRGFSQNLFLFAGSNGSYSGQEYANTIMDEFAYWDGIEPSQAAVNELYAGGPKNLNTLGNLGAPNSWYRLGDGDLFPTITDHGSNTNNGTLINLTASDFVTDIPTI